MRTDSVYCSFHGCDASAAPREQGLELKMTTVLLTVSGLVQYFDSRAEVCAAPNYGNVCELRGDVLFHKGHQRTIGTVVDVDFTDADKEFRGTGLDPSQYANDYGVIVIRDDDSVNTGACWWTAPAPTREALHAALAVYRHEGGTASKIWAPRNV